MYEGLQTFIATVSLNQVLLTLWGLMLVAWLGITAIMFYHSHAYAPGDKRMRRMFVTYIVVSVVLLLSSLSFIFSL